MSVSTVLNTWLKRLYKLLAILLVAFAVLISTLRLFLPYAHNYRQDVEDYINTNYNSNISIGELNMGWHKNGPTLIAQNVQLLSSKESDIFIESLAVEVDFWRSIRARKLVTQDFVISGAELAFQQSPTANSTDKDQSDDSDSAALIDSLTSILLEQISRFSIKNSHMLYHTVAGVRAFTINEMFWVNEDDRHRANGTVIVDGLSSNNLKVLLDVKGARFDDFSGQAYLEANEIDITPWLGQFLAIKGANTHSAINFDAWLTVSSGTPEHIQLALGDNEITWQHLNQVQTFEIIGGDIEIQAQNHIAYSVATSPLTIKRNGNETNKISFLANVEGENIQGHIDGLELTSFEGISPLLLDNVELENLLIDLSAEGRVEDIHFQRNAKGVAVTADFNDINSHFSYGIPGIDNVSGELIYFNDQLQISLTAIDGALDFDKHFKYPIPYTRLSSLLNARFSDESWQFTVHDIDFISDKLHVKADIEINKAKSQPVTMALLASASHGDGKFAEYFYPHLLMGEDLVNYLNSAIVEGEINQALVLFNGPLEQFPFNHHEGIFVVDAELSNSTFKFDSEWPAIQNFSANLNFTNNSMLITGREGTLSGIDVTGVEAAIADLAGEQVLTVDAGFDQVQPQRVKELMDNSPMLDTVGVTLEQVMVTDAINGEFSLMLPLNKPELVIAKGFVDFNNNSVVLKAPEMEFKRVNGRLAYKNDEILVSDIKLDWRGMPLTLDVKAQQKIDFYNVSITTKAAWQNKHWQDQLPKQLTQYANGDLIWQGLLSLNISDDDFTYDYQINSNLETLELFLPEPFNKNTGALAAVNIHAFGNELSSTINARVDNKVSFHGLLDHQETQFSLAHLVLGKQQSWLPTTGFHITAELEKADYEQWQPLVLDILATVNTGKPEDIQQGKNVVIESPSLLSAPDIIQGKVDNLLAYGQDFQQTNFDFTPESDGWLLNISAKELMGSAKFYPDWHKQGIAIDADFIHLKGSQTQEANSTEQIAVTADSLVNNNEEPEIVEVIDDVANAELFAALPPLKVSCGSCRYGQYDFGKLNFTLTREPDHTMVMKDFIAQRGKNKLTFDARWHQDAAISNTRITGTLLADNVASEVESLGFASIIKDSGVEINYDMNWQGGPHDFSTVSLNGELSTDFDDGYLADIDDKGVRLLSFLSLQSLVRKLSFDFRDIFSDGMFYRELKGDFTVKDGVAYTDNIFMKGTAGDLAIVGNTNLNNGELDYRMSYKPNLTSSLPVLAWIATLNPVTFLAGMALDEVITSSVIAEMNFEVTGNLDDPQFKQVSRKNKNISVGRSTPPKIVDAEPENLPDTSAEDQNKKAPDVKDNFNG